MNINQLKNEVLYNNTAIEYDNGDLEKLRKVLKFVFPYVINNKPNGTGLFYYKRLDYPKFWACDNTFKGNSIRLSEITFDNEDIWKDLENSGLDKPFKLLPTLNDVIELRKQFPNNMEFADKFDELLNENTNGK